MIEEDIPLVMANKFIARIKGLVAGNALSLLHPVWRGLEEGGEWQNGQMIGEDIPFGDVEGMHIARIEGPATG